MTIVFTESQQVNPIDEENSDGRVTVTLDRLIGERFNPRFLAYIEKQIPEQLGQPFTKIEFLYDVGTLKSEAIRDTILKMDVALDAIANL